MTKKKGFSYAASPTPGLNIGLEDENIILLEFDFEGDLTNEKLYDWTLDLQTLNSKAETSASRNYRNIIIHGIFDNPSGGYFLVIEEANFIRNRTAYTGDFRRKNFGLIKLDSNLKLENVSWIEKEEQTTFYSGIKNILRGNSIFETLNSCGNENYLFYSTVDKENDFLSKGYRVQISEFSDSPNSETLLLRKNTKIAKMFQLKNCNSIVYYQNNGQTLIQVLP
jgi:hypothetical protein